MEHACTGLARSWAEPPCACAKDIVDRHTDRQTYTHFGDAMQDKISCLALRRSAIKPLPVPRVFGARSGSPRIIYICTCTLHVYAYIHNSHRRRNRGGQGGHGPPTFSRLTHPLLPYAKQKHWNLACLYKPSVSSESKLLVLLLLCLPSTVLACYSSLLLQLRHVSRSSLPFN